jgi:predicted amidohydrolase
MKITCATVQTYPQFAEPESNLTKTLQLIDKYSQKNAELIVFPECSLSGYCFKSLEEAKTSAEKIPGPTTDAIALKAKETNTFVVIGLLEKEGNRIYNAAVMIDNDGNISHKYRKTHLPYLGVDRFAHAGEDPFEVIDTKIGKIGLLICYDLLFPEPARVLKLKGAEIVIIPTNWPQGTQASPDFVVRCRARENHFYIIAANRAGYERGTRFIGRSLICDPSGRVLAEASSDPADANLVKIEAESSRGNTVVMKPGEWEFDVIKDRRPDLYSIITNDS